MAKGEVSKLAAPTVLKTAEGSNVSAGHPESWGYSREGAPTCSEETAEKGEVSKRGVPTVPKTAEGPNVLTGRPGPWGGSRASSSNSASLAADRFR